MNSWLHCRLLESTYIGNINYLVILVLAGCAGNVNVINKFAKYKMDFKRKT